MGIFNLLTLLFIGLKLTGFIDWSWWLVLLPSIITFSIFTILVVIKSWLEIKVKQRRIEIFKNR